MKIHKFGNIVTTLYLMSITSHPVVAQTAPPPSLGQQTQGEATLLEETSVDETIAIPVENKAQKAERSAKLGDTDQSPSHSLTQQERSLADTLFGNATIKETRRESGQVYRIELEHSTGSKQIIEENDSDGQLQSDDNGLDDTPNLTKWQLLSW